MLLSNCPGLGPTPQASFKPAAHLSGAAAQVSRQGAALQLAILHAIPGLATHSACTPFVVRFLKPLSAQGVFLCPSRRSHISVLDVSLHD